MTKNKELKYRNIYIYSGLRGLLTNTPSKHTTWPFPRTLRSAIKYAKLGKFQIRAFENKKTKNFTIYFCHVSFVVLFRIE